MINYARYFSISIFHFLYVCVFDFDLIWKCTYTLVMRFCIWLFLLFSNSVLVEFNEPNLAKIFCENQKNFSLFIFFHLFCSILSHCFLVTIVKYEILSRMNVNCIKALAANSIRALWLSFFLTLLRNINIQRLNSSKSFLFRLLRRNLLLFFSSPH